MAKAKPEKEPDSTEPKVEEKAPARRKCGLIMPISARDGLSEAHWREVKDIFDAALSKDYDVSIVSGTEGADIIHKRIVTNLYTSDVCVCDISTQNPNVMFELGLRLSFDKPTVVVKDDKTAIPFDTTLIRFITYPRDLRYQSILTFKEELANTVELTVKNSDDPLYSFMKSVGDITVPKMGVNEVSGEQYVEESLDQIKLMLGSLVASSRSRSFPSVIPPKPPVSLKKSPPATGHIFVVDRESGKRVPVRRQDVYRVLELATELGLEEQFSRVKADDDTTSEQFKGLYSIVKDVYETRFGEQLSERYFSHVVKLL